MFASPATDGCIAFVEHVIAACAVAPAAAGKPIPLVTIAAIAAIGIARYRSNVRLIIILPSGLA
jgi:hypothetical protein